MLAITGASGHTGRFFIEELERYRYAGCIRCLVRTYSRAQCIQNSSLNIEFVNGNLGNENCICAF